MHMAKRKEIFSYFFLKQTPNFTNIQLSYLNSYSNFFDDRHLNNQLQGF